MAIRDRLSGNEAVATAMRQINPDVMGAFPITPSTEIAEISALPSKDALYSQVFGTLLAPITSLAVVLNQIVEKQNGGAAAEPAAE